MLFNDKNSFDELSKLQKDHVMRELDKITIGDYTVKDLLFTDPKDLIIYKKILASPFDHLTWSEKSVKKAISSTISDIDNPKDWERDNAKDLLSKMLFPKVDKYNELTDQEANTLRDKLEKISAGDTNIKEILFFDLSMFTNDTNRIFDAMTVDIKDLYDLSSPAKANKAWNDDFVNWLNDYKDEEGNSYPTVWDEFKEEFKEWEETVDPLKQYAIYTAALIAVMGVVLVAAPAATAAMGGTAATATAARTGIASGAQHLPGSSSRFALKYIPTLSRAARSNAAKIAYQIAEIHFVMELVPEAVTYLKNKKYELFILTVLKALSGRIIMAAPRGAKAAWNKLAKTNTKLDKEWARLMNTLYDKTAERSSLVYKIFEKFMKKASGPMLKTVLIGSGAYVAIPPAINFMSSTKDRITQSIEDSHESSTSVDTETPQRLMDFNENPELLEIWAGLEEDLKTHKEIDSDIQGSNPSLKNESTSTKNNEIFSESRFSKLAGITS
jgi:hypothetical protein